MTEFGDPLLVLPFSNERVWPMGHSEEVLSACVKSPSLLVTTSRTGEIGFWRLDTGKLNKKYKVRMKTDGSTGTQKNWTSWSASKISLSALKTTDSDLNTSKIQDSLDTREELLKKLDVKYTPREHYGAVASLFLRARSEALNVGNLIIAIRNGTVQLWCTHKVPKYVAQFVAVHIDGDYVTSMVSDSKNDYLFTSFNSGYVKTWYIANFGMGQQPNVVYRKDMSMPSLRLRFPFLLESMIKGYAELATTMKNPAGPLLVNSYRAHLQCIRCVEYIDKLEIVVTSSVDKSVRVWTLAGHYIGTLGELDHRGDINF